MVTITKDDRIFSGFGSVAVTDRQGDFIPIQEFANVMKVLVERGAPVIDSHSNHSVGKIIAYDFRKDRDGKDGLYLTAQIYRNYPSDDEVWQAIKENRYTGFSLGGKAGSKTPVCDENGCYNLLKDIEAWEFSIVETPANQNALIDSVNKLAKSHHVYKSYPITKYVHQCGNEWCVYSESGKRLGTHGSQEDAYKQLYAIEVNKGFLANVKRSVGRFFDDLGEFEIDEWIRQHWRPNHHVEYDWSQPIKDAWHKKDDEYERMRHLKKAKVYVKNPNEAPKGVKVETGPEGGHYYESEDISGHTSGELANIERIVNEPTPKSAFENIYLGKIKNGTGNELFNRDEHERHFVLDNTNDINIINFFTGDPNTNIRWKAAHRADMKHLHKLVNDENAMVRQKVAERIDQNGLHIMLRQDERNSNVNVIIAQRIDLSGLEYIIDKWDNEGLYSNALSFANKRFPYVRFLTPMIDTFQKTGKIELPEQFRNYINDTMKNNGSSTIEIEATDEFYNLLDNGKYNEFHLESKLAWEGSSSSDLALLLKDSIKRQFGGEIRYHDAVKDMQTKIQELQRKYPQELVDNYVKIQKQLTRAYLDVMFPDTDEITIYRGTTTEETKPVSINMKANVQSNPISSWTLKDNVAKSFAYGQHHERKIHGLVLKLQIHKDEIWSTFMSHAYGGNEREILTIGNKDRIVDIVTAYPELESTTEYGKL